MDSKDESHQMVPVRDPNSYMTDGTKNLNNVYHGQEVGAVSVEAHDPSSPAIDHVELIKEQ